MRTVVLTSAAALLCAVCGTPQQPIVSAGLATATGQTARLPVAPSTALPPSADRAYRAVAGRFDPDAALEIVSFMDQYWRLAGNRGYNASIDHLRERLVAAGFSPLAGAAANVRIDEFPNSGQGWDHRVGTLQFDGVTEPPLLSRERDRVALAINSFSTPAAGLRAPLIDVGSGTAAEYDGKTIKGAVVLSDAPLSQLWQEAVKRRGAAGVVSTQIASYIRPRGAETLSAEQQDVLQWDSIPYDPAAKAFGFKSSWRAANRMRQRLKRGAVTVRVDIDASFTAGPNRSIVAEIRGRSAPDERIVMVAHVQEPGANDNASGCGSLFALASALVDAIRSGALPAPGRTLTFMWVDEMHGSRQWLTARPEQARGVQYMLALDMTGEDTGKTGGTFLIEKQADPSAVWPRPSDPNSEWGPSGVKLESLKGSLLTDLHLGVCLRRARESNWIIRTNPYEGGSDHTVFADAGVPSLLNWHFTDRYYHTNQDRPDKVSAAEMQHVGIAVATTAWILAAADEQDALVVADLVADAAGQRLELERAQGRALIAEGANRDAAEDLERRIAAAWKKWYAEALDSVARLPVGGGTRLLRARVDAAKRALR